MEEFQRDKIRELSENLSDLRQAAEGVAVAIETDANIDAKVTISTSLLNAFFFKIFLRCHKILTRHQSSVFQSPDLDSRLQELEHSDSLLKEKVKDLKSKEAVLR